MFVKINGETHYLWRAVEHEGGVLETYVSKSRDKWKALTFLKNAMKRYGRPTVIVSDKLKSYRAALRDLGLVLKQETGRWINNRAENSHLPMRRRERAMHKFRLRQTLQKFSSVHSAITNHFNLQRHLISRDEFKVQRSAALGQ